MSKISENHFTIRGKSGKTYQFEMYTIDTKFNAVSGIYIFTYRHLSTEGYKHDLIYCGKTDDLSTRFDDHHKMNCITRNKANCICVMRVNTEKERTDIETDILLGNNFTCNEVNN